MPLRLVIFEQATALTVLIVLLQKQKRMKFSELLDAVDRPSVSVGSALHSLKEQGLINDETTAYPRKRLISLTDRGQKIAGLLIQVEALLEKGIQTTTSQAPFEAE